MNKEYVLENKSINLLKGISCLIVVLLHCPFPGIIGEAIIYGVRFSVPIFFMITGYYSYEKSELWLIRQIKKTLALIIKGEVFCGLVRVIIDIGRNQMEIYDWIKNTEIIQHPIKTLFFGSVYNGTLWYLYALFWTVVSLYVIEKYFDYKYIMYGLIPVTLLVHIVGRAVIQNFNDINKIVFLFRSAVLFGVPFVLFGRWIAEYENTLKKYIRGNRCIIILMMGIGFEIAEFICWHQYMDLHFSTIIISFALFWWACIHPSEDYIPVLRIFGKKYSIWVYIVHFPCVLIINEIMTNITSKNRSLFCNWQKPIIVIIMSLILAVCIENLKKKREKYVV